MGSNDCCFGHRKGSVGENQQRNNSQFESYFRHLQLPFSSAKESLQASAHEHYRRQPLWKELVGWLGLVLFCIRLVLGALQHFGL
jgi:hypothetical protein